MSTSELTIREGESATYTVVLTAEPGNPIQVTVETDGPGVTVSPTRLNFHADNWDDAQTVSVSASQDDDEDDETVTLSHRADGLFVGAAPTAVGEITVAITDDDRDVSPVHHVAAEREAAEAVLESAAAGAVANATTNIGARFSSGPGGGGALTLAGRRMSFGEAAPAPVESPFPENAAAHGEHRGLSVDELLRTSAFEIALGAAEGESSGAGLSGWTLWGRSDILIFDDQTGADESYTGNLAAAYFGVDVWLDDRMLAGLAASYTDVTSDYRLDGGSGKLELTLTGVHPYARFAPDDEIELWTILGAGLGEIENRPPSGGVETGDARLVMGAAGARRAVARTDAGIDVAAFADAGFGRLETDTSGANRQAIDNLSVDSWRTRLGVEGSWTKALETGAIFTPFVEVPDATTAAAAAMSGSKSRPGRSTPIRPPGSASRRGRGRWRSIRRRTTTNTARA